MQFQRKMILPSVLKMSTLLTVLLTASFASTLCMPKVIIVYAQADGFFHYHER